MIEPETDFTFGEEIISKRLFDVIFHEKTRGYRFQLMYTLVIIHALWNTTIHKAFHEKKPRFRGHFVCPSHVFEMTQKYADFLF